MNNLIKVYNNFVSNNFIKFDNKQIETLEIIYNTWKKFKKINFFFHTNIFNGIYLYGPVGIGKTFIINLFIQNIKYSKKFHFNHFMINLHAHINNEKNKKFALEQYIKIISKNTKVIFIDEMHIFNIVDALLIKRIFIMFKKYKIFILISSNFKPSELYQNGLQRNDFLPFINMLENEYKILNLKNIKDYRRQLLNQSKTYFSPNNKNTLDEFNKLFERFVDRTQIHIKKIKIKSRIIRFEKCTSNIVYCTFNQLCDEFLAHEDYLNIAKTFNLLFIKDVPKFSKSNSDQCRRFISLIDMLYEKSCSVVILADEPIKNLCYIENLNKEFERTASRLYQMTIVSNT